MPFHRAVLCGEVTISANATHNSVQLWHDLNGCNAAIKAFEMYFWYLTEECAISSLFLNRFSDFELHDIDQRRTRTPVPKKLKKNTQVSDKYIIYIEIFLLRRRSLGSI